MAKALDAAAQGDLAQAREAGLAQEQLVRRFKRRWLARWPCLRFDKALAELKLREKVVPAGASQTQSKEDHWMIAKGRGRSPVFSELAFTKAPMQASPVSAGELLAQLLALLSGCGRGSDRRV